MAAGRVSQMPILRLGVALVTLGAWQWPGQSAWASRGTQARAVLSPSPTPSTSSSPASGSSRSSSATYFLIRDVAPEMPGSLQAPALPSVLPSLSDIQAGNLPNEVQRSDGGQIVTPIYIPTPASNPFGGLSKQEVALSRTPIHLNAVNDFGVDPNGQRSANAAISRQMAQYTNESVVLHFPPGNYLFDDSVNLTGEVVLTADAPNSCFFTRSTNKAFFTASGASTRVWCANLTLDGGGLASTGLRFVGVHSVTLKAVKVAQCGTPGFSKGFKRSIDNVYLNNIQEVDVRDSMFSSAERDGIAMIACRNARITQNTFSENGRFGVVCDVDPEKKLLGPDNCNYANNLAVRNGSGGLHCESRGGLAVANLNYTNNQIQDNGFDDWGYGWGIVFGNNTSGQAIGNTIINTQSRAVASGYGSGLMVGVIGGPVAIQQNSISSSANHGIALGSSKPDVLIQENQINWNQGCGVSAYDCPALRVLNNRTTSNIKNSINFDLCQNAIVSNHQTIADGKMLPAGSLVVLITRSPRAQVTDVSIQP